MIKADIRADGFRVRFRALSEEEARQVIYEIIDSFVEWVFATFGADTNPETQVRRMAEERRQLRESSCRIFQTIKNPARRGRCQWTPHPLRLYVNREDTGFQIIVVSNSDSYSDVRPWIPDKYK